MTVEVEETAVLAVAPHEAWAVVGDFAGLVASLGLTPEVEGEGIGMLRRVAPGGGPPITERLESRDAAAMRLQYSIVDGPVPLRDYLATMQLGPGDDPGTTVLRWSATFEPAPGTSEEDAAALVRRIYRGGIAGLQRLFGPTS